MVTPRMRLGIMGLGRNRGEPPGDASRDRTDLRHSGGCSVLNEPPTPSASGNLDFLPRDASTPRARFHARAAVLLAGCPTWTQTGPLRFPGGPSRTSALLQDPGRTGRPDHSGSADAAPGSNTAKASALA
jgi:hypothetical protein